MPRKIVPYFIFFIILSACSHRQHDLRLSEISEIVSDSPKEALRQLDSIDYSNLSSDDRYYHDFLTLKAKDKAYITHKSDSIILRLLNHYEGTDLYPEILYYGGRVYSDLGDYPTALRYFQNALDLLPMDEKTISLRGHALSQTASLLNSIRLYQQAIPYIEESIRIDSILNDSINMMHDTQLLGSIYLHMENNDSAESKFKQALQLAVHISPIDIGTQETYIAAAKLRKGDIDSALFYIRPALKNIDSLSRNSALAYACLIYRDANIIDSAYIYSKELINNNMEYNKAIGYQTLLSSKVNPQLPPDSLLNYIFQYRDVLNHSFDQNEIEEALMQNSLYNYQLHERERLKAEKRKNDLQNIITSIIIILLILCVVSLYLKIRITKYKLKLHEAIDDLNRLQQSIDKCNLAESEISSDLAEQLREKLLSLQKSSNSSCVISSAILESEAYKKLRDYITNEKYINESSQIWEELEKVVIESSKNFKYHLLLLTGGNLKTQDYHLALLIKCGVTPTQMSFLVGKAKGTISYRREALCFRIFGQNLGAKVIDDIIRSL